MKKYFKSLKYHKYNEKHSQKIEEREALNKSKGIKRRINIPNIKGWLTI